MEKEYQSPTMEFQLFDDINVLTGSESPFEDDFTEFDFGAL